MATSGSVNFSDTRDDIIKDALVKIGAIAADETPAAADVADSARALNRMIKTWNANGLQLWIQKRATLFLERAKHQYNLGPTGDHATHSYTRTTLSADEAAGQTILSVTSETGMTVADYIGIVLDSGVSHWTTISSLATLTVASALPTAAASGNSVYFYTSKMHRPLRLLYAWTHDVLTNADIPVEIWKDRASYFQIYNKTNDTAPTRIYYDPQLTNGVLYTNYEPLVMNETLELSYHRPIEDFDAATDNPDFPQEWYEPLVYGLALRRAPDYGLSVAERTALFREAELLGINIKGFYQDSPQKVIPTRF
mgnify:FL=1